MVTIPPLLASAGASFNSPAVMVAPFGSEEVLIAPIVTFASLPAGPTSPCGPIGP